MNPLLRIDPDDPYPESDGAPYDTYGVEEYYVYDPEHNRLEVWLRQGGSLRQMSHLNGWTSPRLGIRFAVRPETLEIFDPAGRPFRSPVELARQAEQERLRAEQAQERAEQADQRAEQEHQRAEQLAQRLRALGVDPND